MAPKKNIEQDEVMIVNDSPGEECRIAILREGHLEELFTERTATATDVGNIYKGRVVNVEPAIQAAFIDYGQGVNGFLHISDLHPRYFPGEERTERVGKKIPRRDRPPIQHALKRGQEILVQVLKEGIGTKGPTLTSYLSIPGRLLVLMPDMDRVGVSRKVEDEEKRREMRQILDSLDLPDGFGFILRTAGYGKTKTELKRDAAYLMRLWKMMEKRIKSIGAPCELYTESDLLIRSVRDVLRPSIKTIIVDSPSSFERASMFLRVVSPRSAPQVIHYRRPTPIFHAFDIERQIELIHSREVPLPSGGRLVIDQTEALVAIDVNSGRSRSARDSETNAYETNVEAADEICRQLRLRDLGGLIVNDLIDMRFTKHRKAIEEQFQNNLKRDRAKATALPISDFGILEMTRQRMRPSIRKSHFMSCSHCNGRGEIKSPDYVAADAARHIGYLLQFERVKRVEVACSSRVASVMLSAKRRELVRLEDVSGKRIDVRVSDAIAVDRVDYYAYDERNADIDIAKLPALQVPTIEQLAAESEVSQVEPLHDVAEPDDDRDTTRGVDGSGIALAGDYGDDFDDLADDAEVTSDAQADEGDHAQSEQDQTQQPGTGGKRRRRRRGGRKHRRKRELAMQSQTPGAAESSDQPVEGAESPIRIHDLARELNVSSREVIQRSEPDPAIHHLANALSTVSAEEAQTIRDIFNQNEDAAAARDLHDEQSTIAPHADSNSQPLVVANGEGGGRKRRRRGRRRGKSRQGQPTDVNGTATEPAIAPAENGVHPAQIAGDPENVAVDKQGRKSRRRRRGRGKKSQQSAPASSTTNQAVASSPAVANDIEVPAKPSAPAKKPRRALYRAGRVAVSAAARESSPVDE